MVVVVVRVGGLGGSVGGGGLVMVLADLIRGRPCPLLVHGHPVSYASSPSSSAST